MINIKLKPINVDGIKLFYKVNSGSSDYGDYYWTDFYRTNDKTKLRKKYFLFGPLIKVLDNRVYFTINRNIEDCSIKKVVVRKWVMDALTKADGYKKRCEEIKNGDII